MTTKIEMSAETRSDLAIFFQGLRDYYGIPSGQPVFPPMPRQASRPGHRPPTGRNRADHPWRGGR